MYNSFSTSSSHYPAKDFTAAVELLSLQAYLRQPISFLPISGSSARKTYEKERPTHPPTVTESHDDVGLNQSQDGEFPLGKLLQATPYCFGKQRGLWFLFHTNLKSILAHVAVVKQVSGIYLCR